MAGYYTHIERRTKRNLYFREVLFTGPFSQLVVMSLKPGEEIGLETHTSTDQFIRVEHGTGKAILDGQEYDLEEGSAMVIPAWTEHNVINTAATEVLKLYTIYSPPEHREGTIHQTKAVAERMPV